MRLAYLKKIEKRKKKKQTGIPKLDERPDIPANKIFSSVSSVKLLTVSFAINLSENPRIVMFYPALRRRNMKTWVNPDAVTFLTTKLLHIDFHRKWFHNFPLYQIAFLPSSFLIPT